MMMTTGAGMVQNTSSHLKRRSMSSRLCLGIHSAQPVDKAAAVERVEHKLEHLIVSVPAQASKAPPAMAPRTTMRLRPLSQPTIRPVTKDTTLKGTLESSLGLASCNGCGHYASTLLACISKRESRQQRTTSFTASTATLLPNQWLAHGKHLPSCLPRRDS